MTPRRKDHSLAKRLKAYRQALQAGREPPPFDAQRGKTSIEIQLQRLSLPVFPYHRDPIASGSIVLSDAVCQCCGKARGAIYNGHIYQMLSTLCPWCIADGSAFDRFEATFFDAKFGDAEYNPIDMPERYRREVFGRTIGFSTNNPITWWVHCEEPAEFVTRNEPYDLVFECRKCGQRQVIEDWD